MLYCNQTEGQVIYKNYERGLLETATSHDHATVGSGSVSEQRKQTEVLAIVSFGADNAF